MDSVLRKAYLGWMRATYKVTLGKGAGLRWDPKGQGAVVSQSVGDKAKEIVRLGFPLDGRETALTKINGLSVLVDGRESQTLNKEGGPYSVDFTRTLRISHNGKLAARVSIKTGLLARLRQAFFLRRIRRLEEAGWPAKKARRHERKYKLSPATSKAIIVLGILAIAIVLTVGTLILGGVVRPVIDSLLHNIAPGFAFPMP